MRTRPGGRSRAGGLRALVVVVVVASGLTALAAPATGQSSKEKPAATEVGVTPTEVHIAVVADVDPGVPNVGGSARDAVQAFARYANESCAKKNRCIAGRKLVVDLYDSKLNPNETVNAEITACANDFAMVGTLALFMPNVDNMR